MAHNSGGRPERMRIAVLTARQERARNAQAVTIVDHWNAELATGKRPQFSPTLEAAFRSCRPWLRVFCAGCSQQYEIDLQKIVRPKDFPIMALRAAMVCESLCRGEGPEPQWLGLTRARFDRSEAIGRG